MRDKANEKPVLPPKKLLGSKQLYSTKDGNDGPRRDYETCLRKGRTQNWS